MSLDPNSKDAVTTLLGLCSLGVRVPKEWTDEQVEQFANEKEPTGISSRWTIKRQAEYDKDLAEGSIEESAAHERVQCLERPDFCHLLLYC